MRTLVLIAALLIAILVVLPVLAANNDINACTDSQLNLILVALRESGFADSYQDLSDAIKEMNIGAGDLPDLATTASELQAEWWSNVAAQFPRCALAVDLKAAGGRTIDELTIAISIGLAGLNETLLENTDTSETLLARFQYHINEWTDAQDDFLGVITDLAERVSE